MAEKILLETAKARFDAVQAESDFISVLTEYTQVELEADTRSYILLTVVNAIAHPQSNAQFQEILLDISKQLCAKPGWLTALNQLELEDRASNLVRIKILGDSYLAVPESYLELLQLNLATAEQAKADPTVRIDERAVLMLITAIIVASNYAESDFRQFIDTELIAQLSDQQASDYVDYISSYFKRAQSYEHINILTGGILILGVIGTPKAAEALYDFHYRLALDFADKQEPAYIVLYPEITTTFNRLVEKLTLLQQAVLMGHLELLKALVEIELAVGETDMSVLIQLRSTMLQAIVDLNEDPESRAAILGDTLTLGLNMALFLIATSENPDLNLVTKIIDTLSQHAELDLDDDMDATDELVLRPLAGTILNLKLKLGEQHPQVIAAIELLQKIQVDLGYDEEDIKDYQQILTDTIAMTVNQKMINYRYS